MRSMLIHQVPQLSVVLDVSDPESVAKAISTAIEKFNQLDILINNAGIHRSHPFIEFPLADFELVYGVNVRGNFLCSQAAAKQMISQGHGGCIISMASASGKKADPGGTAYNSSKSAVIGLTRVMALELGKYGIRANCILPGATDTEMLRGVFEAEPDLKKILEERTPLERWQCRKIRQTRQFSWLLIWLLTLPENSWLCPAANLWIHNQKIFISCEQ